MAITVNLPNNWRPRPYQMPAWKYLENGGRHAELIWHRRSGKDEICLHHTACKAFERPATYWHMLPQASQARKAIWAAINPHSGKRRIDEAFPHEVRAKTLENEMFIQFKNGATWQVIGSDNYNSLVGSPPAGVVYSEWALANPSARAYLRPIMNENNGWQVFITTPRGKNHAFKTYEAAKKNPDAFAQLLKWQDTGAMSVGQAAAERAAYVADFGEDQGGALFEQEFECSFEAAVLGAYYASQLRRLELAGRYVSGLYDPSLPVHTAWDIGRTDDTSIWFFQVFRGEIRLVDFFSSAGYDVPMVAEMLEGKPYRYGDHWLPHDARAKTFASSRSVVEQLFAFGFKAKIAPHLSVQDGIQAVRMTLEACWFDQDTVADGISALVAYHREWDDDRKAFMPNPEHDWSSHPADAFRMLAVAWRAEAGSVKPEKPRFLNDMTVDELWRNTRAGGESRI